MIGGVTVRVLFGLDASYTRHWLDGQGASKVGLGPVEMRRNNGDS